MKLISMQIKGDKDQTYTVYVDPEGELHCTCPDHFYREHHCKHIKYAQQLAVAASS